MVPVFEDLEFLTASLITTPEGSLWTSNRAAGTLTRVDIETRTVTDVIDVGKGGDLLAFEGAIWFAADDGTISPDLSWWRWVMA